MERAVEQADEILKIDSENMDAMLLKTAVYLFEKKIQAAGDMLGKMDETGIKKAEFYLIKSSYYRATKKIKMAGDVQGERNSTHSRICDNLRKY